MIRLELAGVHTRIHSSLCHACPNGPTGCCASPPGVDWADIGRIVRLGGRDWLLEQIGLGRLRPGARGLLIERVQSREANAGVWPTKCVYHGSQGCTIASDRRAATCNYYICEDALAFAGEAQGDRDAVAGRREFERLTERYGAWDLELGEAVAARWPGGAPWDAPFLDWVGERFGARSAGWTHLSPQRDQPRRPYASPLFPVE